MIEGISKITKNTHFNYVDFIVSDTMIVPSMKTIQADTYVDDDLDAESELVYNIKETCLINGNVKSSEWKKTNIPEELNKSQYYNIITKMLYEQATMSIFKNTKRCIPNFVLCSSAYLPIFAFAEEFNLSKDVGEIKGTYLAGHYNILRDSIAVFVSPFLDKEESIWGVNDDSCPGIVTFLDDENKLCNKIVNPSNFVLIKLED